MELPACGKAPLIRDTDSARPSIAVTLRRRRQLLCSRNWASGVCTGLQRGSQVIRELLCITAFFCSSRFDQGRVFLFDAFMIPGTAISATHIKLDLRGNGDVP
jgi:hypothetical protein